MENLTNERRDQIMDFYLTLNNHDLEYLLCLASDRIGVPVDKGDHVDYQTMLFAHKHGAMIDIVTREFNERIDEEMEKRQDKQIDNLLNDE